MRARRALFLVAIAGVFLVAGGAHTSATSAQTAENRIEIVRAAYDMLMDLFYAPPEPGALLAAGWSALGQEEVRRLAPAAPALGPLPAEREPAFEAFSARYRDYVAGLPRTVNPAGIAFVIAEGMARSLNDGHTRFLPPQSYQSFLASTGGGGRLTGTGMRVTPRPPFIVTAVAADGSAAKEGIAVGDVVVALDGTALTTAAQGQALQGALARQDSGTVRLTVERVGQRRDIRLARGPHYFPALESRLLPGGAAYLRLDSFVVAGAALPDGTELLSDLDRRLDELEARGASGLVLDLRGNPGGYVVTAHELLGRFLPEDALTTVQSDRRGHEATGIVGGHMRRGQWPMVVLVDGGSFSASELTAGTLKEADRALLVGTRTGGSLTIALFLPLPAEAGLAVAFGEVATAKQRITIDRIGFPVDVEVPDTRTPEDYRAGRDPQLEAAVAALASAPQPPAFRSATTGFDQARLTALLSRYMPEPDRIPKTDRLATVTRTVARAINHPNQSISSARDPLAAQARLRARGWLGSYAQGYGAGPATRPAVSVSVTLFATPEGAAEALSSNESPDFREVIPSPIELGEQTVASRGRWSAIGSTGISWRHGNVIFSVSYGDTPGEERLDVAAEVARLVDQAYLAAPLDLNAPTPETPVAQPPAEVIPSAAAESDEPPVAALVAVVAVVVVLGSAGGALAYRRAHRRA